jgi:hypothetical protein
MEAASLSPSAEAAQRAHAENAAAATPSRRSRTLRMRAAAAAAGAPRSGLDAAGARRDAEESALDAAGHAESGASARGRDEELCAMSCAILPIRSSSSTTLQALGSSLHQVVCCHCASSRFIWVCVCFVSASLWLLGQAVRSVQQETTPCINRNRNLREQLL